MQTEQFYRKRDKALKKSKRIVEIMRREGVVPHIGTLNGVKTKPWACTKCGSRHSRAADVIHHWWTVHFWGERVEREK